MKLIVLFKFYITIMEVIHDKEQQIFYIIYEDKESYVRYTRSGKETLNILRTYVPPEQRNNGMAAQLAKAALDYAKENNLKVIPTCSYIDYYIDRNKEYEELLV